MPWTSQFLQGLRFLSRWYVRWPLVLLLLIVAALLPYAFVIGGPCRVIPGYQVGVRAQLNDEIASINVTENQFVRQGDVIATLAAREELADVHLAEAELARAQADLDLLQSGTRPQDIEIAEQRVFFWEAQLKFAESEFRRAEELRKTNTITPAEFERHEKSRELAQRMLASAQENLNKQQDGARDEEIRSAEAVVARAKANLSLKKQMASLRTLIAPVDGVVATPFVKLRQGQSVQPGDLIAVIQDPVGRLVEIEADEAAAEYLKIDQPVLIRLNADYGRLRKGHVQDIAVITERDDELNVDPYRSDREGQLERNRQRPDEHNSYVRILVSLDEPGPLMPGLSGYSKVVVAEDTLGRAFWRHIVRFFRVEAWSWLP